MKRKVALPVNAPLLDLDHGKPMTRREFVARGMMRGAGVVSSLGVLSLFANPRSAYAALSSDLDSLKAGCGINVSGAGKIPFICFDLAGGANIAGSNVLVGQQGGQEDFLSTAGYSKLGLPGNMVPGTGAGAAFIDRQFGLAFHTDSGFLRGMLTTATSATTKSFTNGFVIPARSENDTGNNPHNPLYGIFRAGADGELLTLIGSQTSVSGGNSMAPAMLIDPSKRPTKVDRPSDVNGLVNTGKLVGLLDESDAVAVMESIARISQKKLTAITASDVVKDLLECGYIEAADIAERYADPSALSVEDDTDIVAANGAIFTPDQFNGDSELRKAASVMKLVVNGYAGAGCITMGGFDYHTGERGTGERRDFRAGQCIGACLEYAQRKGKPLMIYVYSDGSLSSNGRIDNSADGRGKGEWTGDNSSTAASFALVYNPGKQPVLLGGTPEQQAQHQQIGWMRSEATVETAGTPAANNVNLLVESVLLNYMSLHSQQGQFADANFFPNHSLGNATSINRLTAFEPLYNGTVNFPV